MASISRCYLPIAELCSVRRALHSLFPADRRRRIPAAASRREDSSSKGSSGDNRRSEGHNRSKGFGAPVKEERPNLFDKEEGDDDDPGEMDSFVSRPEYQIYQDSEYRPKRFIGAVEVAPTEGSASLNGAETSSIDHTAYPGLTDTGSASLNGAETSSIDHTAYPGLTDMGDGRILIAKANIIPGDLIMLLPALAFLEGDFQQAPEPEDLHIALLEDGLSAAQRQVLDVMNDGTESSKSKQFSLTTLDTKFWTSRGNNDPSAPLVDAGRLLHIIKQCSCTDTQQDTSAMQVRQQMPSGFIGLWPEFSLIAHSCVPNTSLVVIGDRMMVHSAAEIKAGQPLTRNHIGSAVTGPLSVRQAAVEEESGRRCGCPRCRLEETVSEDLRQTLQDAFDWFTDEGLPQWNTCQEGEDLEALKNLRDEAEQIVSEVEEALEAEERLEEEERLWLRAGAYDCYDLLVMCDEFINQDKSNTMYVRACLELIRIFAPGSESHTSVAVKYEMMTRARAELAEYLAAQQLEEKQKSRGRKLGLGARGGLGSGALLAVRQARELKGLAEEAGELYLEAFFTRYGFLSLKQLGMMREGLEMYTEALEQMSIMQSQGKVEDTNDYVIDGVTFSITDKLGSLAGNRGAMMGTGVHSGGDGEKGFEVSNQDGVRLMIMDTPGEETEDEGQEVVDVEAWPVEEAGADDDNLSKDAADAVIRDPSSNNKGLSKRVARRTRRPKD